MDVLAVLTRHRGSAVDHIVGIDVCTSGGGNVSHEDGRMQGLIF